MKKFMISLVAAFSFSATAADVAVVWGEPNFDLEFVQNTVVEHVNVYEGEKESRYSTDVARQLVRSGAKTIASFGVLRSNGTASELDFAQGLSEAALRSKVVFTVVGPIRGAAVCDVIREFADETVFVFPAKHGDRHCGAGNGLQVIDDGHFITGAHTAADLSNFATLNPHLSGTALLRAYRYGRAVSGAEGNKPKDGVKK